METRSANDQNTDFAAWARLLIYRKVPDRYQHLINSEVVFNGAAILKRGEAFEVRICDRVTSKSGGNPAAIGFAGKQILVTSFPNAIHALRF
jgi:hypothetical protein